VRRASFEEMSCSIARSLEVIGEWWTLLIVRDAFLGVTRFDEFASRLGIARNVLTSRLDTLVEAGVMERVPYEEGERPRYDYKLTRMGRDLYPVVVTLRQWGDRWLTGEGREPVLLEHVTCGHQVTAHLVCDHCDEALVPRETRAVAGPGLSDPEAFLARARR